MTDTIGPVPARIDQQRLAQELVEQAKGQGLDLVGPDGLLAGLTKRVLEAALEAEMAEHLGYEAHDAGRPQRGELPQRDAAQDGPDRDRPGRDRGAPRPGGQLRAGDREEAAAASGLDRPDRAVADREGLTTGEVAAHFAEVYGASVGKDQSPGSPMR